MNKSILTGEVTENFQPSHEDQQKFNDNEHNMKAWFDMYLLSLSDVLVTTSLSTFGYVAQGLGNLRPWLLYKLVNNKTYYPDCEREFSMEPCYHSPPKHYCSGKSIKYFASSFLYMRECKDFGFGVKLFDPLSYNKGEAIGPAASFLNGIKQKDIVYIPGNPKFLEEVDDKFPA
ncbi:hypothetical protein RYX36_035958 [Vicia faba]